MRPRAGAGIAEAARVRRSGPGELWRRLEPLAGPAVALAFAAAVYATSPFRALVEIDTDEGVNCAKALLVDRGYHLYADIWSDQPPVFTLLLRAFFGLVGWDVERGRILVLLLAAATVFAVYDALRIAAGHRAAVAGAFFLVTAAFFRQLAVSIMIGLPSIAFATLSLWALVRFAKGRRRAWIAASGALFGLSAGTKLFVAFLAPLALAWLFLDALRAPAPRARLRALGPPLFFVAGLAVALGAIALAVAPGLGELAQLVRGHKQARETWHGTSRFAALLAADREVYALALLGTIEALRARRGTILLFAAASALALAALAGHAPHWYHHCLLASVPASVVAGFAVGAALGPRPGPPPRLFRAGVLAAVVLLAARLITAEPPIDLRSYRERDAGDRLALALARRHADAVEEVLTDRPIFAFRLARPVDPWLAVFTSKRVKTGELPLARLRASLERDRPGLVVLHSRAEELLASDPGEARAFREALGRDYCGLALAGALGYGPAVHVRRDLAADCAREEEAALASLPPGAAAADVLGAVRLAAGDLAGAEALFERAQALAPLDPPSALHLARLALARGEIEPGFRLLERAQPPRGSFWYAEFTRARAWLLATCPRAEAREGRAAEALIRGLLEETERRRRGFFPMWTAAEIGAVQAPDVLDAQGAADAPGDLEVLAAALAAQGRFAEAAEAAGRASATDPARLAREVAAYRAGEPWTEAPGASPR
jgi:tetratricopeptide (TPR) repeat protein